MRVKDNLNRDPINLLEGTETVIY